MSFVQCHARIRLAVIIAAAAVAAWMAVQFMAVAHADYAPPGAPYMSRVGTAGTLVQNQGTPLDASDAKSRWNAWTARSYLSMGTGGCGFLNSCIIYANAGSQIYYVVLPACNAPTPGSGAWAATYVSAGTYENNTGCTWVGSQTYPVFVVSYVSAPSYAYYHVQRHEMGHALALNDTSTTCWYTSAWYPLMNNGTFGTCSGYGYNFSGTTNEINAVTARNGW